MRTLYIDAGTGVAGNMLLGGLIGLGWDPKELQSLPGRLGLPDVAVQIETANCQGISASLVTVDYQPSQTYRHLPQIEALIQQSDLPERVRSGACQTFRTLAEAEARVHGLPLEKVHFHEVGAADALIDIVGVHWGINALGVDQVLSSPLPLSRGQVPMAHGCFPLPAPATVEILTGVPTCDSDLPYETVTPTGAALVKTLASSFGEWPRIEVSRCGWGAGTSSGGNRPNAVRLVLGETRFQHPQDQVWVVECEVDDLNPEFLEPLWSHLFEVSALDVFFIPVQMKKGRSGVLISVVTAPENLGRVEEVLLSETSTFGVRRRLSERTILAREEDLVETEYGPIRIKTAPAVIGKAAPEADDVRSAAQMHHVPMAEVYQAAVAAWRGQNPPRA